MSMGMDNERARRQYHNREIVPGGGIMKNKETRETIIGGGIIKNKETRETIILEG